MKAKLYTYEKSYKIGNREIYALAGIKETGIGWVIGMVCMSNYLMEA